MWYSMYMRRLLNSKFRIGFVTLSFLIVCVSFGVSLVQAEPAEELAASSTDAHIEVVEAIASTTASTTVQQEDTVATSTPEAQQATTTATTTTPVSTSTSEIMPDENKDQILTLEEEQVVTQVVPEETISLPPLPQLSVRNYKKEITIDTEATHHCTADVFRIDISGKDSVDGNIVLEHTTDAAYEIEIGSLPEGIDITFATNGAYTYRPSANDTSLGMHIVNESGSQKGDFTIPLIYTKKGTQDSSSICQINVINQ